MNAAAKNISEIMSTDLLVARPYSTAEEARQIMTSNSIRHLPVIDDDDRVVGILSDRDLANAANEVEVCLLMKMPNKVVNAHVGLDEAIDLMIQSKVSSCLVEDEGELVGIITSEDLLRVLKAFLDRPARGSIRTILYNYVTKFPLGSATLQLIR